MNRIIAPRLDALRRVDHESYAANPHSTSISDSGVTGPDVTPSYDGLKTPLPKSRSHQRRVA